MPFGTCDRTATSTQIHSTQFPEVQLQQQPKHTAISLRSPRARSSSQLPGLTLPKQPAARVNTAQHPHREKPPLDRALALGLQPQSLALQHSQKHHTKFCHQEGFHIHTALFPGLPEIRIQSFHSTSAAQIGGE